MRSMYSGRTRNFDRSSSHVIEERCTGGLLARRGYVDQIPQPEDCAPSTPCSPVSPASPPEGAAAQVLRRPMYSPGPSRACLRAACQQPSPRAGRPTGALPLARRRLPPLLHPTLGPRPRSRSANTAESTSARTGQLAASTGISTKTTTKNRGSEPEGKRIGTFRASFAAAADFPLPHCMCVYVYMYMYMYNIYRHTYILCQAISYNLWHITLLYDILYIHHAVGLLYLQHSTHLTTATDYLATDASYSGNWQ